MHPGTHIIASGGGGFARHITTSALAIRRDFGPAPLERYALELTDVRAPKVCLIPTASGDARETILWFYATMGSLSCVPTHLNLFRRDDESLEKILRAQDVVYVSGGNTANLLAIWRLHGMDRTLANVAAEKPLVIFGVSAGALCWFESGFTDSSGPGPDRLTALAWLPGSFCPHYDSEPSRRDAFRHLIGSGMLPGGFAVDDGAAVHFVGGEFRSVLTERSGAAVRRLTVRAGALDEQLLDMIPVRGSEEGSAS